MLACNPCAPTVGHGPASSLVKTSSPLTRGQNNFSLRGAKRKKEKNSAATNSRTSKNFDDDDDDNDRVEKRLATSTSTTAATLVEKVPKTNF